MQYMLLIYGNEGALSSLPSADRDAMIKASAGVWVQPKVVTGHRFEIVRDRVFMNSVLSH
jgi:hypothetical protein